MQVSSLDHLVLAVAGIKATCEFYRRVLEMEVVVFGAGRRALSFGAQKTNLHQHGREPEPKASVPTPGSGDLCFLSETPLAQIEAHLRACNVEITGGPSGRTGATGPTFSLYFRDPDGNLIEVANQDRRQLSGDSCQEFSR